jgi:hypothetical protein
LGCVSHARADADSSVANLRAPREGLAEGILPGRLFSIGVGEPLLSDWQREIFVMAPLRGSLRQQA